jgi:hypothetical protein
LFVTCAIFAYKLRFLLLIFDASRAVSRQLRETKLAASGAKGLHRESEAAVQYVLTRTKGISACCGVQAIVGTASAMPFVKPFATEQASVTK